VSENQIIEINAANILCKLIEIDLKNSISPMGDLYRYSQPGRPYIKSLQEQAVNIAKNIHRKIIEMEAQSE
jgi:hypothetical protein